MMIPRAALSTTFSQSFRWQARSIYGILSAQVALPFARAPLPDLRAMLRMAKATVRNYRSTFDALLLQIQVGS